MTNAILFMTIILAIGEIISLFKISGIKNNLSQGNNNFPPAALEKLISAFYSLPKTISFQGIQYHINLSVTIINDTPHWYGCYKTDKGNELPQLESKNISIYTMLTDLKTKYQNTYAVRH